MSMKSPLVEVDRHGHSRLEDRITIELLGTGVSHVDVVVVRDDALVNHLHEPILDITGPGARRTKVPVCRNYGGQLNALATSEVVVDTLIHVPALAPQVEGRLGAVVPCERLLVTLPVQPHLELLGRRRCPVVGVWGQHQVETDVA